MSVFIGFWTKMTEMSLRFFSRGQKVKVPLYLISSVDFLFFDTKNNIFSKVKNQKKTFYVPTASRPTSGGGSYGTIWYHKVPYGTIWYHMVAYGTIWYLMVPYGMLWYRMVPYGTMWYHMVPYGTIWHQMVP